MARVRNHAAEYAALKARAQAAGLSTRAFRRARAATPETYYAPRALKARTNKTTLLEQIARANVGRGPAGRDYEDKAAKRLAKSTPGQRSRLTQIINSRRADFDGEFWDAVYEDDLDLDELFFYN